MLKGNPPINVGDQFVFQEEYGTATLKGTKVEVVIPWLQALVPGRRYLLFGSFAMEERFFKNDPKFFRNEAYQEPSLGGLLLRTYLDQDTRPDDEFEHLSLDQAILHVQNEMRK